MVKKKMPRVIDPDDKLVHYAADSFSGNVTLCGITDWLNSGVAGKNTNRPVGCDACISVKTHCDKYAA